MYPKLPIPGVAALTLRNDTILLTQRGKAPSEGMWGLPGGAVELGERVEEAVIREVKEETGITVKPVELIAVFDSIHKDQDGKYLYHYILLEYLCDYVAGEVTPNSDAPDAKWVPLNDLDQVPIMPSTKKFILKIFGETQ
ncbi:NUDIX domain-containing protein [Candidatus Bathyarchaeota archaeon]|nr:NUDIX domain-containing protein [Candidatus Bathyarchaeota archaeon]